jgi:hypothetical protein
MDIEQQLQDKGLDAPRVTPADIEAEIASEWYFTAREGMVGAMGDAVDPLPPSLGLLTFCVLVLKNGFTVHGESACASAENFDEAIGQQIARKKATEKIWPLLGFRLRDALHEIEQCKGGRTQYHPATTVLIEGLKQLGPEGAAVIREWDKARAKIDGEVQQTIDRG